MMKIVSTLLLSTLLLGVGCGGDGGSTTTNVPSCTGASCSCPAGASCAFTQSTCGDAGSCSLACEDHNACSGSCESSCSIDCGNGSVCTTTVGESGSVSCSGGSTCHVTCTGQCSVSCTESTCDLKCAGDSAAKPVSGSGSCQ